MLKLAKLTDYATVLMTVMAADPARLHNAQELAQRSHLGLPTTAKLLKQLAKGGLVESLRGAHGGYRLSRDPARITVADVIDAVEGPIEVTSCSGASGNCSIEHDCAARTNWRLINHAIRQALVAVTLAHMAAPLRSRSEVPLTFNAATRSGAPSAA